MSPDVDAGAFWLVDPLDGTKEFLSGNGEFTVNIALIEGPRADPRRGPGAGARQGLVGRSRQRRQRRVMPTATPHDRGTQGAGRRSRGDRQPLAPGRRDPGVPRPGRRHRMHLGRQLAQVLPGRPRQGRPLSRASGARWNGTPRPDTRCSAPRAAGSRPGTERRFSIASPASRTRRLLRAAPEPRLAPSLDDHGFWGARRRPRRPRHAFCKGIAACLPEVWPRIRRATSDNVPATTSQLRGAADCRPRGKEAGWRAAESSNALWRLARVRCC